MSGLSASPYSLAGQLRLQWSWHLGALAIVAAAIVALFRFDAWNAVVVWWIYPTYSHCFLILPISAWLVWEKRHELAQLTPVVAPKAIMAVPALFVFWLAGDIGTMNEVRQFAVVALLQVAIFALLGPTVFRAVLFPALYLFFLVPFGQYLIPPMQNFATWFTDTGLTLMGVPHFTEGTTIELANGKFEIAEACAGLRFLIATLALGVLFSHLAYRKWYKIALFLAACVVVPLIGNGLRCLGIIELAHLTNNELAVGADHLVYGWIFNSAILLVLLIFGLRFRDAGAPESALQPAATSSGFSRLAIAWATVGVIAAVAVGPAFAIWHDGRAVTVDPQSLTSRLKLSGWTDHYQGSWRPIYPDADAELMTSFAPPNSPTKKSIDVALVYYGRNRPGRSLLATTNQVWDPGSWRAISAGQREVRLGSTRIAVNEAVIASGSEQRLVWWTYWMDDRFTTHASLIKLLQFKTVFTGNESAALIAFSLPVESAIEEVRGELDASLADLGAGSTPAVTANRTGIAP